MAEFEFYITKEDHESLLEAVFQLPGVSIIPNKNYETATLTLMKEINSDLLDALSVNPRCYIVGCFTKQPVGMTLMEKGKYAGTYVVTENRGGPLISLSLSSQQMDTTCDGVWVPPSRLAYQDKFWTTQGDRLLPASAELKTAYKAIKQSLGKVLKKHMLHEAVWLSSSAQLRFMSGELSLLISGRKIAVQRGSA